MMKIDLTALIGGLTLALALLFGNKLRRWVFKTINGFPAPKKNNGKNFRREKARDDDEF